MSLKFDLIKTDGTARRGRVHTAHGDCCLLFKKGD